ncbi:MAG TPA: hypothetical protein VG984_02260 [Candidatus Paceibacterota bacterium]|nr:hypothetical protein [Candidatus Paceibacterota bacterium]
MAKKNSNSSSKGVAVGAGLAAAAIAAAGAYWFYGSSDAKKHRAQVKSWMLKARAEVLEAVEKLGDIDKQTYLNIVDQIVGRYSKLQGVTAKELASVTKNLKATWSHMDKARKSGTKKAKKSK